MVAKRTKKSKRKAPSTRRKSKRKSYRIVDAGRKVYREGKKFKATLIPEISAGLYKNRGLEATIAGFLPYSGIGQLAVAKATSKRMTKAEIKKYRKAYIEAGFVQDMRDDFRRNRYNRYTPLQRKRRKK